MGFGCVCQTETYRWARCKEAAPLPRLRRMGLPLPEALLDVLEPALAWEDLQARCAASGVAAIGSGLDAMRGAIRVPDWCPSLGLAGQGLEACTACCRRDPVGFVHEV